MKLTGAILVSLIAFFLIATPVFADTPDPDSTPTVEIDIYGNVLETGDMLVLAYANIPYAAAPSTDVTETFSWSFRDGANVFGSTTGFVYQGGGYGYNVYGIYLSAANVTANGIVWGTPYDLRLAGSPALFADPPVYDFSIDAADYTDNNADTVKSTLASRIIFIATDLDSKWGLSTTTSLVESTDTGTALSIRGETVFRGAIIGIQAMALDAFAVQITILDYTARTWSDNYIAQLENQYTGTWIETSREAGAALFGATYDLLTVIIMVGLGGGLIAANIMLTSDFFNAMIDVGVLMVFGARLDFYDFFFLLMIAAVCAIYVSRTLWFRVFS